MMYTLRLNGTVIKVSSDYSAIEKEYIERKEANPYGFYEIYKEEKSED